MPDKADWQVQLWFRDGTFAKMDLGSIKYTEIVRVLRNAKNNGKPVVIDSKSGKNFVSPPGLLRYKVTEINRKD